MTTGNDDALRIAAEFAAAFAPSKERHIETTAQGRAFLDATSAAWPCAALARLTAIWDGPLAYPVAVGVAAAGHGIAVEPALAVYLQSSRSQSRFGRRPPHPARTDRWPASGGGAGTRDRGSRSACALTTALDELGSAAFRADLASMRHETQYTRLFRS